MHLVESVRPFVCLRVCLCVYDQSADAVDRLLIE